MLCWFPRVRNFSLSYRSVFESLRPKIGNITAWKNHANIFVFFSHWTSEDDLLYSIIISPCQIVAIIQCTTSVQSDRS